MVDEGSGRPEAIAAAQKRLLSSAHAVVRAWLVALTMAVLMTLAAVSVTVLLALDGGNRRPYALGWALLVVAAAYNVTRYWPRQQARAADGVSLSPGHTQVFGDWTASRIDGWRTAVRLVPSPSLFMDQRTLVLGLPLVLSLREQELITLLRDVREVSQPNTWPAVAHALNLERGRLGRGSSESTGWDTWLRRRLLASFNSRVETMHEAHADLARELRSGRGQAWHDATAYVELLQEAWSLVAQRWLVPALRQGTWHDEPFTGLRSFTAACERDGLLLDSPQRPPGHDVATVLPDLASYERQLAELLVEGQPHDDDPIPWSDHPAAVVDPEWRAMLADGLDAARQATGTPQQSSIDAILRLITEGWGESIAAVLTPKQINDSAPASDAVLGALLEAATAVALLDSGRATLHWEWPHGAVLRSQDDGSVVPISEATTEPDELRAWLTNRGVDPAESLWLNSGNAPAPERPLYAFVAFRRLSTYHVVVSTRAVRLFKRDAATATKESTQMWMRGPDDILGARMEAVTKADFADQEDCVALNDVVQATFSPQIGGHWWSLRMRTPDRTVTMRGNGDGGPIEAWLAPLFAGRLHTRWLHAPPRIKWLRDKFGFLCLGLGGNGIVFATVFAVDPPDGTNWIFGVALGGASVFLVALGFLPDLIASVVRKPAVTHHPLLYQPVGDQE